MTYPYSCSHNALPLLAFSHSLGEKVSIPTNQPTTNCQTPVPNSKKPISTYHLPSLAPIPLKSNPNQTQHPNLKKYPALPLPLPHPIPTQTPTPTRTSNTNHPPSP